MRLPSAFAWMLRKEIRELLTSRAWWILIILTGPLTGLSFISAVRTYSEASGMGGTSTGVGEAFSPLIGILAPTFSACELIAAFLLPFVAIRVFAHDRQTGALKIEAQHPIGNAARVLSKALILLAAWIVVMAAPLIAVLLWSSYGGSVYRPELAAVVFGHILNGLLAIAVAAAASSIAEHPATAAILTLAVTVGTWVLVFVAAIHGGIWQTLAEFTPTALVARFQHGLISSDVTLSAAILVVALLAVCAAWLDLSRGMRQHIFTTAIVAAIAIAALLTVSHMRASWDLSENRMNSFSRSDEAALRSIAAPVQIEVHLAPEDPRRDDLDRRVIAKLRRTLTKLNVRYESATSIGLFEQSDPHYGEIVYRAKGRELVTRATTEESALESIYDLSGATPQAVPETEFRGHPLQTQPRGAVLVFYFLWPLITFAWATYSIRRT